MTKNFPNLNENMDLQIQEALKTPNKTDMKNNWNTLLWPIIFKWLKTKGKEKNLKVDREKEILYVEIKDKNYS